MHIGNHLVTKCAHFVHIETSVSICIMMCFCFDRGHLFRMLSVECGFCVLQFYVSKLQVMHAC